MGDHGNMSKTDVQADLVQQFRADIKNDPVLSQLVGMTPAEVEQFAMNEVTDLQSTKVALAKSYKLQMMLLEFLRRQFDA